MANTALAPEGQDWILVASATASTSATIDFEDLDSTYHMYLLVGSKIIPATDGTSAYLRIGTGATPTYQSGASDYAWNGLNMAGTQTGATDTADSEIQITNDLTVGSAAGEGLSFSAFLFDPSNSNTHTHIEYNTTSKSTSGGPQLSIGGGWYLATTAVTAIRFLFSSGNIASGEFRLYGLKDA